MTDFTTLLGALAILLPAALAGLHVFIRRRLAAEARAEWIERQSAKPATIEGVTEAEFIRLFVLSHAPRWMLYAAGGLAAALAATPVALFVIPFVYNQVWLLNGAPDWAGETGYVYQFTLMFGLIAVWAAAAGFFARLMHQRTPEPFNHALARARGEPIPEDTGWRPRPKWARRARPDA
jgi:hypothetical protein